jgi:enediyne biosynthesis thioesterase
MRFYEYRHIITFHETNFVGNVYYTHYLAWQGICREIFLRQHAPSVIKELADGLSLATVRCSCEYFAELNVFEEVLIRMGLADVVQNRLTLLFEYWRVQGGADQLAARGEQQIACMKRESGGLVPTAIPAALREALAPYA